MDKPGLENTVAPPKAPSNIRIGVRTNRGPISTRDVATGPLGCVGSFSTICNRLMIGIRTSSLLSLAGDGGSEGGELRTWKFLNQILESTTEKVRI